MFIPSQIFGWDLNRPLFAVKSEESLHLKFFVSLRILSNKAPSNKTKVRTKSINMDIWVIGTLNQLFIIRGSYTEIKFSKE